MNEQLTQDELARMVDMEPNLSPARGVIVGIMIGTIFWLAVILLYLILR